jgi:CHAD domain-containing protein
MACNAHMRIACEMGTNPTRPSGRGKVSAASLDCAAAFQKIALDSLTLIKAHHGSACAGDAEAVHQIRVAMTRLRAAVAFFAPITVDAEWLRLKKEIAWLNTSLSAARDSDVVVDYSRHRRYRLWAQGATGESLDQRQLRDHRELVRCLRSARFRRLIAVLADWISHGSWLARWTRRKDKAPLEVYSAHELDRWCKRLVRKGRDLKTLGPSRRHRLRIKIKRFRYMLEALTETVAVWRRDEFRHLHRPAKRLQRAVAVRRRGQTRKETSAGLSAAKGRVDGRRR